ncbi:MAG: hypothetical protein AB7P78_20340, partial [Candidatus Binatia bacterium]
AALDAYTIAYDYFAGRPTDRKQQSVDAAAWFPRIKFRQDAMIAGFGDRDHSFRHRDQPFRMVITRRPSGAGQSAG